MLRRAIPFVTAPGKHRWGSIAVDQIFPREILIRLADAPLAERGAAFERFVISSRGPDRTGNLLWLAEFTLRMASAPGSLEGWASPSVAKGIKTLLDAPSLVCAARFLVLAVDQMRTLPQGAGEAYSGWGWP